MAAVSFTANSAVGRGRSRRSCSGADAAADDIEGRVRHPARLDVYARGQTRIEEPPGPVHPGARVGLTGDNAEPDVSQGEEVFRGEPASAQIVGGH